MILHWAEIDKHLSLPGFVYCSSYAIHAVIHSYVEEGCVMLLSYEINHCAFDGVC